VPVAPDLLKALESFTLGGRKTGNERRALTPIVDEMRCKSDYGVPVRESVGSQPFINVSML
jgi:hypothetical protein